MVKIHKPYSEKVKANKDFFGSLWWNKKLLKLPKWQRKVKWDNKTNYNKWRSGWTFHVYQLNFLSLEPKYQ